MLKPWLFFLTFGTFLALVLPPGEGIDETAHFAYVHFVSRTGSFPSAGGFSISKELHEFLLQQPVSWSFHTLHPELNSHEEFWGLAPGAREQADRASRQLRLDGDYVQTRSAFGDGYERHQPPLFYAISAPAFLLGSRLFPLPDLFLLLRLWSTLLVSLVVPVSYLLAQRLLGGRRRAETAATLVALFPGLYPAAARVSNDALVLPLAAMALLLLDRWITESQSWDAAALAVVVGLGLLTKAFFIPIAAAIAILALFKGSVRLLAAMLIAAIPGLTWYTRNFLVTGSWTGLPETVSANATAVSTFHSFMSVDWAHAVDLAAVTHIWTGAGSLLGFRSWIYDVAIVFFGVAMIGFAKAPRPRVMARTIAPFLVAAAFLVSMGYVATQVYQSTGRSVMQGWYLALLVPLEMILFVAGASRTFARQARIFFGVAAALLLIALVYGAFFIQAPYYSGLIAHGPFGHLQAYHPQWTDFSLMSARLVRNYTLVPPWILPLLGGYTVTLGLFLAARITWTREFLPPG